jgi:aryl-alcohol dehydrogenase-like predicted oxidoreductase
VRERRIGANGPGVGAVGLGCMPMHWAYAGERSDATSIEVIRRALDLGVTFLDTADVYGPFTNEALVGRALTGRREEAVVATKVGLVVGPNGGYPLTNAAHPDRIRDEVDGSLRRLGVETIDLYYLHRVDPEVPLEDSWGALAEIVAAGKARALGLSEVSVDELDRAHAIHPVTAVQSELSLWWRDRTRDVMPWCREHGVALVPYAPLGRGFLTGTITAATFGPDDFRSRLPRFTPDQVAANQALVDVVRDVASRHGATPAQVALAWLLALDPLVLPIPGTKRQRYLEENAAAADLELTAEDLATLDAMPAPSAPRY